jgi:hypothetical protein
MHAVIWIQIVITYTDTYHPVLCALTFTNSLHPVSQAERLRNLLQVTQPIRGMMGFEPSACSYAIKNPEPTWNYSVPSLCFPLLPYNSSGMGVILLSFY